MPGEPPVLAVVPAYDAGSTVAEVVRGAAVHVPVVVVDDGSEDDTAARAEAAGAEVVRQAPNQGKGEALKTGFRKALEAGVDAVVTLDADGQHDPAEIPRLLSAWRDGRPALVVGARDFGAMPPVRRAANTIGRWTLSLAVGRRIPDNQSGYRVLSRRLVEAMVGSDKSGFEFEVEMILVCLRRRWSMAWVPIRTIYGEQGSHINPVEHAIHFFRMVARARAAVRGGGDGRDGTGEDGTGRDQRRETQRAG